MRVLISILALLVLSCNAKWVLGPLGKNCEEACYLAGMNCNARIDTGNTSDFFAKAGVNCSSFYPAPWWASDQPCRRNDGVCLGYLNVPDAIACQGHYPTTQRVCNCEDPNGKPFTDETIGTGYSQGRIDSTELTVFSHTLRSNLPDNASAAMTHFWMTPTSASVMIKYYIDGETTASIQFKPSLACGVGFNDQQAPWGLKWFGKGAKTGAWFWNLIVPFQKSVRVTATANEASVLYIILRGYTRAVKYDRSFEIGTIRMPRTTRLQQFRVDATFQPLEFVPLVQVPAGKNGYFFMHTLSVRSSNLNFLEACYHMFSPPTQEWPGVVLSTGTEDFFDSAYYFNAGEFHLPVSGFTHYGALGNVTFSAYRIHEMDPMLFSDGMTLLWRVGDAYDNSGIKCLIKNGGHVVGRPGPSDVEAYAWVYIW